MSSESIAEATVVTFPTQGRVVVEREAIDLAPLADDEALIESEVSIISAGTELARLHGIDPEVTFPTRPGYGTVGRVRTLGRALADFQPGQRVFFAGKHASLQRFRHAQGHQWGHLFPVPEALDPVDAAVACLAQIAYTAPAVSDLALGDQVAVFGLGPVGLLAAQLYRLRGARVLGVDPVASRCALARRVGIDDTCDAPPEEQVDAVRSWSGGAGVAVTCDATGLSRAVASAIAATADFGQVVLLGSPRAAWQTDITPLLYTIHHRGLVLRGAHMWRYPVTPQRNVTATVERNFATIFALIGSGELRVRELISHLVPPDRVPEAYAGLREDPERWTGAVIDWRASTDG